MDPATIIQQAERIIREAHSSQEAIGPLAEARELTRVYAGEDSSFYQTLLSVDQQWNADYAAKRVAGVLRSFISFVQNGLLDGVSIERRARLDVVSDFLEQAQMLLESKGVHPAAPAVLIGASLEESLRNWVEDKGLSIGNAKPGMDAYAKALREADLITKQDMKDITAWAGIRNHAAHGEWEAVEDPARVRLMLEGVNLFLRKYAA